MRGISSLAANQLASQGLCTMAVSNDKIYLCATHVVAEITEKDGWLFTDYICEVLCDISSCWGVLSCLLPYLLTYLLTPWSRVLLEKLTGSQCEL